MEWSKTPNKVTPPPFGRAKAEGPSSVGKGAQAEPCIHLVHPSGRRTQNERTFLLGPTNDFPQLHAMPVAYSNFSSWLSGLANGSRWRFGKISAKLQTNGVLNGLIVSVREVTTYSSDRNIQCEMEGQHFWARRTGKDGPN